MTETVRREARDMSPDPTERLYLTWVATHKDQVIDLLRDARSIAEIASGPHETLALACAAAVASTSLGDALEREWSLHTPQDAAVVAAVLRAQLAATVGNLHRLTDAVGRIAARAEMEVPPASGHPDPTRHNVADALERLTTIADEVAPHVAGLGAAAVTLEATPTTFRCLDTVHATLNAVSALIGGNVTLVGGDPDDHGEETSCGCTAVFTCADDTYYLAYTDMGWMIVRASDRVDRPDGSGYWPEPGDLDVLNETPHPEYLADRMRRAMGLA